MEPESFRYLELHARKQKEKGVQSVNKEKGKSILYISVLHLYKCTKCLDQHNKNSNNLRIN